MRLVITLVSFCSLVSGAVEPDPWRQSAKVDGVTVYTRTPEGTSVAELKAVGLIEAPPARVWEVIRDYEHYTTRMPYTEVAKVLRRDADGRRIRFYSVINAPLVSRRDYVIDLVDESNWDNGKGFLKSTWRIADSIVEPTPNVAPQEGIVRVTLNNGYWLLEPREAGRHTFTTYYLYTDPGGSIPKWIVNKANSTAVPDVFRAVRSGATQVVSDGGT